jgi:endonuclease/exonuclease/phosphatase family metal-dependent hydrolase
VERWGVFRLIAAAIMLIAASVHAVEIRVATFNVGAHFNETFFDYGLGAPGTPDHDTVRDILARIDADVVALQEIHSADLAGNPSDLKVLADTLGYPHVYVAPATNTFDTTFRVAFLSRFPFLNTLSIDSPPGARELTRRHPVVKVDVPGTHRDPVIVSTHLKAGTSSADRFRRAVEMMRLTGHLTSSALTDDDNFIVLGDFNPSSINATFTELPPGLPGSYVLGNDIAFPVTYSVNPLAYFTAPAAVKAAAFQLDGSTSTFNTLSPGGPELDLILVSPAVTARPLRTEIYNSALDLANDDGLPKSGSPLAADTSAIASDHYPVFADFGIDSPQSYVFSTPGEVIREDFSGFIGVRDPAPWSTSGGSAWLGIDDGSSSLPGWRLYGSRGNPAAGFLPNGEAAAMRATFRNQSPLPLTAVEVTLDAGQWRAVLDGAADSLHVDILTENGTVSLPGLTLVASQSLATGPVADGAKVRLSAMASHLWIEPGASFELRVSFAPGPGGGSPATDVFINEFHYDNAGSDTGEFVEIAVAPGFDGNVSDVSLLLYNGGNGAVYQTHGLGTFTQGATTASGHRLFHKPISGIQNGAPDGFAVVHTATAQVLHFISYEGAFTPSSGPADGMISEDIGVSQAGTEPAGYAALGLTGTGAGAADFSWTQFGNDTPYSPGQPNAGQTFVNSFAAPQGLGFDNLEVVFLTDNDLDGDPDVTDPDDDNDGQSDEYEIAFGSDPLDPDSRFEPQLAWTGEGLQLSFPGAAGIAYTVQFSETLDQWDDFMTLVGQGAPIVVPLPMAEPSMFFRLRAGL